MKQFKKLAIASAVCAAMLSSTAQAHVSYNTNLSLRNDNAGAGPWTAGAPQNYTGTLPATWVANVHNADQTYVVSTAHANTTYPEDGSAYIIETYNNKWNPSHSWGNALDYGLIDLHAAGDLTIKVAADSSFADSDFKAGFTLWSGWDTGTGNRHGPWNADPFAPGDRGATGISYVGHASTNSNDGGNNYSYSSADEAVEITFEGLDAGIYTLWIGGNGTTPAGADGRGAGKTSIGQQYVASITASPVPVPAAVWLMGTGLLGLMGMRRNKVAA